MLSNRPSLLPQAFSRPRTVRFGTQNPPQAPIADRAKAAIRVVPDFPKKGIPFLDIMPVLGDATLLKDVVDGLADQLKGIPVDKVVGIDSRGNMLAAPLALKLGAGFVPIRKAGKLPGDVEKQSYALEYGTDTVEIQKDAFKPGTNVVLVDDILATGGTASAAITLLGKLKANLHKVLFLAELDSLKGRQKLSHPDVHALIHYA